MKNTRMHNLPSPRAARDAIVVPVATLSQSVLTPLGIRSAVAELLRHLDERSRRIMHRRFGLDGSPPKTLQAIGTEENVTRERIRQIEHSVLCTLHASHGTSPAHHRQSSFPLVREALRVLLQTLGGVAREDVLLHLLQLKDTADHAALRFLLKTLPDVTNIRETEHSVRHYRQKGGLSPEPLLEHAKAVLRDVNHLLPDRAFLEEVRRRSALSVSEPALRSVLSISRELVRTPFGEWGLRGWAEATPRSVGDKAYVVLKRAQKPLHFTTITDSINTVKFDPRSAHAQTVHNELIRDDRFVLVGRGLYALREWGHTPGTVADVLERILLEQRQPLSRDELVERVLKERMVRRNTILLALQNRERFSRQTDGRYVLAAPAQEVGHAQNAGASRAQTQHSQDEGLRDSHGVPDGSSGHRSPAGPLAGTGAQSPSEGSPRVRS